MVAAGDTLRDMGKPPNEAIVAYNGRALDRAARITAWRLEGKAKAHLATSRPELAAGAARCRFPGLAEEPQGAAADGGDRRLRAACPPPGPGGLSRGAQIHGRRPGACRSRSSRCRLALSEQWQPGDRDAGAASRNGPNATAHATGRRWR